MRLTLFLVFSSAFAFAASAAYDLFKGGYPPPKSSAEVVGSGVEISLSSRSVGEAADSAFDSRFKVTEVSDALAVPFSSLPVAFCITIR